MFIIYHIPRLLACIPIAALPIMLNTVKKKKNLLCFHCLKVAVELLDLERFQCNQQVVMYLDIYYARFFLSLFLFFITTL